MTDKISLLITLSTGVSLERAALKVPFDTLNVECFLYPLEPENKDAIKALLPLHVQSIGEIVEVSTIFDVIINS